MKIEYYFGNGTTLAMACQNQVMVPREGEDVYLPRKDKATVKKVRWFVDEDETYAEVELVR